MASKIAQVEKLRNARSYCSVRDLDFVSDEPGMDAPPFV